MASLTVSLPETVKDWVERQTQRGRHRNAEAYLLDLIERDQARQAALDALQQEIDAGIDSGPAEPLDLADFKRRVRA